MSVTVPTCSRCGAVLPAGGHECEAPREKRPALEAWHRPLAEGRAEILCRAPGYHLRVSAPEAQAWEAVDLFEAWTGLVVQSEKRPPRARPIPAGQLTMLDLLTTDERESNGE